MKIFRVLIISFTALLPMFIWGAVPVDSVRSSITDMMRQYPVSTLLDIYKSSFQNLYGLGHIVSDTAKAKAYLDWSMLKPLIDLYINSSFDNKDAYTQDGPQ